MQKYNLFLLSCTFLLTNLVACAYNIAMIKKLIIILPVILFPMISYAFDGELYFGKYLDSTFRANPDGGMALYVTSVEVGHIIGRYRPYIRWETLIDGYEFIGRAHPASIKYYVGITVDIIEHVKLELSHLCWHPVDSYGTVEQYNLVKVRIKF